MPESLIEQLPKIVAEGKKEVERILDRLSGPNRLALQTNEYVLPSKDKSGLFRGEIKEFNEQEWHNRLIYGDNLLVMQALLAGDPATGLSSMRGKIRFSSLQYLSIKKPVIISYSYDIDEIKIELDNYILLSPDALPSAASGRITEAILKMTMTNSGL
ncbi:MAG TPA: hypothetical protein VFF47_04195 [Nitrospirota bacterium]|nr:hypothetical protein [Nitrospirota bacterium]